MAKKITITNDYEYNYSIYLINHASDTVTSMPDYTNKELDYLIPIHEGLVLGNTDADFEYILGVSYVSV